MDKPHDYVVYALMGERSDRAVREEIHGR